MKCFCLDYLAKKFIIPHLKKAAIYKSFVNCRSQTNPSAVDSEIGDTEESDRCVMGYSSGSVVSDETNATRLAEGNSENDELIEISDTKELTIDEDYSTHRCNSTDAEPQSAEESCSDRATLEGLDSLFMEQESIFQDDMLQSLFWVPLFLSQQHTVLL